MATIIARQASSLSAPQTGNGASTNIADTGTGVSPATVVITTTVGGSPTVTVAIQGSMDATNWFALPYKSSGSVTESIATFVITTATTNAYYVSPNIVFRYTRLNYSANNNVTITADVFGD